MSRFISVLMIVGIVVSLGLPFAAAQSRGAPGVAAPFGPGPASDAFCRELIVDGGFEQSGQDWTGVPNPPGRSLISDFYPKSGARSADLSGQDNTQDRLSQAVTLPAGMNEIMLSYWWAYQTEEPDLSRPWDKITVQLYRTDGTLLATIARVDYTGLTDWVWNPVSSDLSPYAGQAVVLRFTTETDETWPTRFFVDDVSIRSCVRKLIYLPLIRR